MKKQLFSAITFVLLFGCIACSQKIQAGTWPDIRDGVVHIRITEETPKEQRKVLIKWQDAWISESQIDHIYILNPDGSLLKKLVLTDANTPGSDEISLLKVGDYQVHVTGASFRNTSITTGNDVATLFEPVKVHKSISAPAKGKIFFKAPQNTAITFGAKYHGGPEKFLLSPVKQHNKKSLSLNLKKYKSHDKFDTLTIPAQTKGQIWQVTWKGSGKVSFWLDDIDNLFATQQQHLFSPKSQKASSEFSVSDKIVGKTPAIGAALPFTQPPKSSHALLENWRLSAANHYTFSDALSRNPGLDLPFLDLYENTFNIKKSTVILAKSGRKPVIDNLKEAESFLKNYLKKRHSLGLLNEAYLAIADEPNLNYPDFESFERDFSVLAKAIKQHPDPSINQTGLAIPQSSRFINGPTRSGSSERKGIDWAGKLIKRYGKWIDAISWHEWMVRDLIDTSRYDNAVTAAKDLIATHQQYFNNPPKLIIGQTNISSGKSLSPYEQQTEFAALWWASVVVQSSQAGALDQLIWFKAADDPDYRKGLANVTAKGYKEKPVSLAMTFINRHLGHWVLKNKSSSHPELDMLATLSKDKTELRLLGVNKAERQHDVSISLPLPISQPQLVLLGQDEPQSLAQDPKTGKLTLTLKGARIFVIKGHIKTTEANHTH